MSNQGEQIMLDKNPEMENKLVQDLNDLLNKYANQVRADEVHAALCRAQTVVAAITGISQFKCEFTMSREGLAPFEVIAEFKCYDKTDETQVQ